VERGCREKFKGIRWN